MQDFNFQLVEILRASTLRFDGFPLRYLIFHSNLSGRGVKISLGLILYLTQLDDTSGSLIDQKLLC